MQPWILLVIGCSVAFLIGIGFRAFWRILVQVAFHGLASLRRKAPYPFAETQNVKIVTALFALLSLSIASWFFGYYVTQQTPGSVWGEIATAVFGVSTAGLLGGVVFELFLRRELLAEISQTLAEIVTTDKNVVRRLFDRQKRNQIIETMLQINTGNDLYGSGLYSDFVARFTDEAVGYNREFRFDFRDHVTLCDIDPERSSLHGKYYEVIDRISYLAELRPIPSFILGCASTEDQLYALFADPACIYRWLLKTSAEEFVSLIGSRVGFTASLVIDGVPCEVIQKDEVLGSRGFEVRFQNPFLAQTDSAKREKIGKLVEFRIEARSLHPCEEAILSVHLVYPVKGAEIGFDYERTRIRGVTRLHFLTAGSCTPVIETGAHPMWGEEQHKLLVTVRDDHWLFPDSGVVFVWPVAPVDTIVACTSACSEP